MSVYSPDKINRMDTCSFLDFGAFGFQIGIVGRVISKAGRTIADAGIVICCAELIRNDLMSQRSNEACFFSGRLFLRITRTQMKVTEFRSVSLFTNMLFGIFVIQFRIGGNILKFFAYFLNESKLSLSKAPSISKKFL